MSTRGVQQFARDIVPADALTALAEAVSATDQPRWLLVDHGIVDPDSSARLARALG